MKKAPRGIKIISIFLVILVLLPILIWGLVADITQGYRHKSLEEKAKIIQSAEYEKLNIRTVDDYDRYWEQQSLRFTSYQIWSLGANALIVFVALYGLWTIKNWGRLGIMTFAIFRIFYGVVAFYFGIPLSVGDIVLFVILMSIIFYLTRPRLITYYKSNWGENIKVIFK